MRICHLTSMHDWDDDRIYQRACLGLARAGNEVHLVATEGLGNRPVNSDVQFHWIKYRSGWKRRWYSSKEAVQLSIETGASIFHFHDPDLLPHIKKIKLNLPHAKIVYDIHENYETRFYQWKFIPNFLRGTLAKWFRSFEILIIKSIDGYSTVSKSLVQLFTSTQKPSLIIRNTVDVHRLKEVDLNQKKYPYPVIYTSGTHSHDRNILNTVRALSEIVSDYPKIKVMFAGRYLRSAKQDLQEVANDLNLSDNVLIEGMLPWTENFTRTARAFCGCVFYKRNANNQVTIPNRIYEYMYSGIPVVASDYPELRRIVESANCGVLVNADDPKSIGEGIYKLLAQPELASELGRNGKKAIEGLYGYHIDMESTINFYRNLIKTNEP